MYLLLIMLKCRRRPDVQVSIVAVRLVLVLPMPRDAGAILTKAINAITPQHVRLNSLFVLGIVLGLFI